jgi:PAS domain S-box-containing protein
MKADFPRFTILAVSDNYLDLVHKQRQELLGNGLFEVFPGSRADPSEQFSVYNSFKRVIETGLPDELPVFKYEIFVPGTGRHETYYWTNVNQPILNEQGKAEFLINTTTNITEQLKQQQALKEALTQVKALQREQVLNEKLAATNDELNKAQQELRSLNAELEQRVQERTAELKSSNEELAAAHQSQLESNQYLAQAQKAAEVERTRLHQFIMQAPAGICVLSGPDLVFELLNPSYQMLMPGRKLLNRAIFEAMLELVGTHLQQKLLEVYQTGKSYYVDELLVPVAEHENGPSVNRYFTFNYLARHNDLGNVDGILVFTYEVTEQVNTRRDIADANERLNIAIDAGGLGYTQVNLATGELRCNEAFMRIFGRTKDEAFFYADVFEAMLPSYREDIKNRVRKAQTGRSFYQASYEIKWPDGSLHWISAHGRARYDMKGNADRMIVIVADVTEQKRDEQRKNDFIGMVSHELKTPLTSMKGYIQMLKSSVEKGNAFPVGVLDKADRQVAKMTTMINGFLNVSRLESGKIHIDLEKFDLVMLLKEIQEESVFSISSHQLAFEPMTETWVNADREKIGQVIQNLISNAV